MTPADQTQQCPNSTVISATYPPPLDINATDLDEAWETWYEEFQLFLSTAQMTNQPNSLKSGHFLRAIGPEAHNWMYSTGQSDEDSKSYDKVVEAFEKLCQSHSNEILRDFQFFAVQNNQKQSEEMTTTVE